MRIVIIGGSGHVGTYLVPRLVEAEHEVINVSRAQREPYKAHSAWRLVQQVTADRTAEDAAGVFGQRILELKPDVVIDLICFTLERPANLKFLPWDEWRKAVAEEFAELTWDHIAHSPNASIAKAQRLLVYRPRFSSLQAIHEAVEALIQKGIVQIWELLSKQMVSPFLTRWRLCRSCCGSCPQAHIFSENLRSSIEHSQFEIAAGSNDVLLQFGLQVKGIGGFLEKHEKAHGRWTVFTRAIRIMILAWFVVRKADRLIGKPPPVQDHETARTNRSSRHELPDEDPSRAGYFS
jgi:hypothetical protein